MPMISIPYTFFPGKAHLLPICEVSLLGPRRSVQVDAIADSGADHPIFRATLAESVGIELLPAPNSWVTYGAGKTWARKVSAQLAMGERVWETQIWFVDQLDLPYELLGRIGVFDRFDLVRFIEGP